MKEKFQQFVEDNKKVIKTCRDWTLGALTGAGIAMIILSDYGERSRNAGYVEGAKSGLVTGVRLTTNYYEHEKKSSDTEEK